MSKFFWITGPCETNGGHQSLRAIRLDAIAVIERVPQLAVITTGGGRFPVSERQLSEIESHMGFVNQKPVPDAVQAQPLTAWPQ